MEACHRPPPGSGTKDMGASRGRSHRTITIDAKAELLARRPLERTETSHAAPEASFEAPADPRGDDDLHPVRTRFGRRSASPLAAMRRGADQDLLSQALDLGCAADFRAGHVPGAEDKAARQAARRFGWVPGGLGAGNMRAGRAAMMVAGFAFGAMLLPFFLLSAPEAPIAAPYRVTAADGFVLGDVEASIAPRGESAVLLVEATVTNTNANAAPVPPLEVTVSGASGIATPRPVGAPRGIVKAGDTVRISSAQAVATGTAGTIAVGFGSASR